MLSLKYNPDIRMSFLKVFIPGMYITNTVRLDEHMNPTLNFQNVRQWLADKNTINSAKKVELFLDGKQLGERFVQDTASHLGGIACNGRQRNNGCLVSSVYWRNCAC